MRVWHIWCDESYKSSKSNALNSFAWTLNVCCISKETKQTENKTKKKKTLFSRVEQISINFAIKAVRKLIFVGKGMLNAFSFISRWMLFAYFPLLYIQAHIHAKYPAIFGDS